MRSRLRHGREDKRQGVWLCRKGGRTWRRQVVRGYHRRKSQAVYNRDDEIAAAAFLLDSDATFVTGTDPLIDGGAIAAMRSGVYEGRRDRRQPRCPRRDARTCTDLSAGMCAVAALTPRAFVGTARAYRPGCARRSRTRARAWAAGRDRRTWQARPQPLPCPAADRSAAR